MLVIQHVVHVIYQQDHVCILVIIQHRLEVLVANRRHVDQVCVDVIWVVVVPFVPLVVHFHLKIQLNVVELNVAHPKN